MALKLVQAFDDYDCSSNELFGIRYNFFRFCDHFLINIEFRPGSNIKNMRNFVYLPKILGMHI